MSRFFDTPIEYLKGIGPQRAALLQKEVHIYTYGDFIQYYPFRYDDRSKFHTVKEAHPEMPAVQIKGKIVRFDLAGFGRKKRLVATFADDTGRMELVWFQGVQWIQNKLQIGVEYVVFGKPNLFGNKISIAHPEVEPLASMTMTGHFFPVYPLTERLKKKYIDNKTIGKWMHTLLHNAQDHIHETLPEYVMQAQKLISKKQALTDIHFPTDLPKAQGATKRLKFEEFFFVQWRLLKMKLLRDQKTKGFIFQDTNMVTSFYNNHLPFELTTAQKRVIKEIYADMKSGKQMNRLLQGDVGSGKTIVAFISMLFVVGSGAQAVLMAPTELLAQQHYANLKKYSDMLALPIALLTGSVKQKQRKPILEQLVTGELKVLVGTHALLEDKVQFQQLGLAVIDEQHRFGVAQRSKLWQKNIHQYPHVMVMTATPIPRTLAMTLYGDLDVSVIDELPKGRKPIKTVHRYDSNRLRVFQFLREQLSLGQQVYIVYPLIEESEKLDFKHLMDGYESISLAFPDTSISIVHGKMKSDAKKFEMARFQKGETKIMVATTVIEVGVDVPNASVMVVESAERFGLSQLHQLRGRVGRGAQQSYCILMTGVKLTKDAKTRMATLCQTSNGFDIAETDLQLRGPGDLTGTQQSGALDLTIGNLAKDGAVLQLARETAKKIMSEDPMLEQSQHQPIKRQIESLKTSTINWSRIS